MSGGATPSCPQCGYSLAGIGEAPCPECGLAEQAHKEYLANRFKRFRKPALLAAWVNVIFIALIFVFIVISAIWYGPAGSDRGILSEIVTGVLLLLVFVAVPALFCVLVFASRATEKAALTAPLVYGRYLCWVWSPIQVLLIVAFAQENGLQVASLDTLRDNWWYVLLACHVFWNSHVVISTYGVRIQRWLFLTLLLAGNVLLLGYGYVGFFLLALGSV